MTQLIESSPGQRRYGRSIKAAVRGLWSGVLSIDQFDDNMLSVIRINLTRAWAEGAKACGIGPDELSADEIATRDNAINREFGFAIKFGDDIEAGSKANGGKLTPLLTRVDKWAIRYLDVVNQAKVKACKNQKGEWRNDPLKDTCPSCKKLNGKVKRFRFWETHVMPQGGINGLPNNQLKCKGVNCGCGIFLTDKPISRGPLPKLP